MLVPLSAFHWWCHLLPRQLRVVCAPEQFLPELPADLTASWVFDSLKSLAGWHDWLAVDLLLTILFACFLFQMHIPKEVFKGRHHFCWFSLAFFQLITECDPQGALRQDFKPVQHIRFLARNQFFSLLILKHHSASFWFSLAPKTPSNYIYLNTEAIREMSALIFQMFMTISWSGY